MSASALRGEDPSEISAHPQVICTAIEVADVQLIAAEILDRVKAARCE